MEIKNCDAYELVEKQEIAELKSVGYLLRHKKTKARVALLENDDENKVFSIGFRTPPKDSTGVAHIVEHTVLCGSRDFPVKDPFVELAKGSLNTFLNAMTYADKTVYPVASCNDKDFQNLMHVYLDAVFYPNIYKEEKIFRQEGWHYELEHKDAPLCYNGIVFNEMKGAFSSPDQILWRSVQHSLFRDTAYGVESGGDPAVIPSLSYEDYLDFHRKYYHPSNSYIYLYGNMDMEEKLDWIDKHYLEKFEYLEVDSEIELQEAYSEPAEESGFYAVTEGEDTEGRAYFSYNVVCGSSTDRMLYRAMSVFDHVLVESVGAPVKQALLDAGIGTEITSCFAENYRQLWFSIVAKNVSLSQKDEFMRIVRETLQELADSGLNKKSLRAAIHSMEFHCREADFGSFPKGLMYGLQMLDSWLYDDNKPFIHLNAGEVFEELKEKVDTGYFEELLRTYFLDNTHASMVIIQPKVGLTALMDREEREKLEKYRETLSGEELERLVRETEELKAYQEEPTRPEDLECIPLLAREDIEKKAQPFFNEERVLEGKNTLFHNVFTNGIAYLRFAFDVNDLKEYAPYIGLLTELIGAVDTDLHDKLELNNEIYLHSGNFSVALPIYSKKKSDDFSLVVEVGTKVLYPEIPYMMGLVEEILTSSHVWDEKRLREVIGEARSAKQISLQESGHVTAAWRAMSYLRERHFLMEQYRGITYYEFLCDMDDHFEERKENLIAVLKALAGEIFTGARMCMGITADEAGYGEFASAVSRLAGGLPERSEEVVPEPEWTLREIPKNEGFKTSGKVQYVARAGDYRAQGVEYDGSYKVVKTILSYDYLWNEIRVKGGAYGAMCGFTDEGLGYLMSYRDPNLAETNDVYIRVPEYLEAFDEDERTMMKYIIGTISDMDTPLTPRAKGERSYAAYMEGDTFEDRQRERDQVLSATPKQVKKAAAMIRALLSDGMICVLGGEEKVEKDGGLFQAVRTLK